MTPRSAEVNHIQERSDVFWSAQPCASHIWVSIAIGNGRSQMYHSALQLLLEYSLLGSCSLCLAGVINTNLPPFFLSLPISYRKLHEKIKQDDSGQLYRKRAWLTYEADVGRPSPQSRCSPTPIPSPISESSTRSRRRQSSHLRVFRLPPPSRTPLNPPRAHST